MIVQTIAALLTLVVMRMTDENRFLKSYAAIFMFTVWIAFMFFMLGYRMGNDQGVQDALAGKYHYEVTVDSTLVRIPE